MAYRADRGPDLSRGFQLWARLVGQRPMDEVQVDVVQVQILQGALDSVVGP